MSSMKSEMMVMEYHTTSPVMRVAMDVQFKVIDNTPGLAVKTPNTQSWTPIATRTRARLKK